MSRLLLAAASAAALLVAAGAASPAAAKHYRYRSASPPVPYDRYCLQGRIWDYPGNCQFASYSQCMATASGTDAYCGINPHYAFGPEPYYR